MSRPRNIVLLVADSLRYDSVHHGGARLPFTTAHATRFTQARSGGCWTLPGTASLFTGLMPHEHGADAQSRGLRKDVPTLAAYLAFSHVAYRIDVGSLELDGILPAVDL